MKLWDKGTTVNKKIEDFTIGRDRELDVELAPFDILGTMAHITMLQKVGLLTREELEQLLPELKRLYQTTQNEGFTIEEGVEDVHSQVEMLLTAALGDVGKKVHSGRSRNDQVLLDLKLYARHRILQVTEVVADLFSALQKRSEAHKDDLMPGYTHLQVAMPSSFGLWFGAYAESLADDMHLLLAAYRIVNQNPLGAAAGYGSSFPLDRQETTRLLGFEEMSYNVVYAQMGRGKMERSVAMAMATVAATVSKLAMDACLYMSQNFSFISLPDELTTGSSIMPHKKNPDVFELIRAKCNKLQALPQQIMMITSNLPSGYFRDLQITKEVFLPAFDELISCLELTTFAIENMTVKQDLMKDPLYKLAFSVEEVNARVLAGVPFREAYKQVGQEIEKGIFEVPAQLNHTHEGSLGNLCNTEIQQKMNSIMAQFAFEKMQKAILNLLT
jgi:argininosuccinate lyase